MSPVSQRILTASLTLALFAASPTAHAQLFEYSDNTGHRNRVGNGSYTPNFDELPWPGRSLGVGNSAGGVLNGAGSASSLSFDSDIAGGLTLGLGGASQCTHGDSTIVVFLDTLPGGQTETDAIGAGGTPQGAAIAAPNLQFAPGFDADFAITVESNFFGAQAFLWDLRSGIVDEIRQLNANAICQGTGTFVADGFTVDDLGIGLGDPIDYLATLVLTDTRRHNEFHGTVDRFSGIITTPTVLVANEFARFNTVQPVVINEVDADQAGTDTQEFVELIGPPGLDLRNCGLVLTNGTSDRTYSAIALSGSISSLGFYVIGNVSGADDGMHGSSNALQNGADAVSLHATASFDGDMDISALHSIADAVVYDTDDIDDATLLAFFTPGQPQVNERENGDSERDSIQRCADGGARFRTDTYFARPPTPGAPNDCNFCGSGIVDTGEACDAGRANGATTCGCQNDCQFGSTTTVCNPAGSDPCDADDLCDGAGSCQPAFASVSTICRAAADACDVPEFCSGSGLGCPSNSFASAGTSCGGSTVGACDAPDTCDGSGVCTDNIVAAGMECRAAGGDCGLAELCDGTSKACPADVHRSASTECRGSAGACDPAELCTGASPVCPANLLAAAGLECRASAGLCDVAESCTGTDPTCPANLLVAAGTECRAVDGVCDAAETCTGTDAACPADDFLAMGTECRAAAGLCDVAEACSGTARECPADALAPAGTECRSADGLCDVAESCSGSDAECPMDAFAAAGTECRASADDCDAAERCSGATAACPSDESAPDGTTCDDGMSCTEMDRCEAGACIADPIDCDDGDPCTADMCGADGECDHSPIDGCGDAGILDPDAAVDADAGAADAAVADAGPDGGTGIVAEEEGCGCRTLGDNPNPTPLWPIAMVGLLWWRRRQEF